MKRAYINGILLDGTQQMEPQAHKVLLCEDGVITAIADEGTDLDGYEVIDLHGGYAMLSVPGPDQPACASGRQRQAQRKAAG